MFGADITFPFIRRLSNEESCNRRWPGLLGRQPDAAIHMIRNADIQYMGCDYLAELTLSIMAKQQLKDPTKGFAPDFTTRILKEAGKEAWDKHIKICTNAGGMNINGCVDGIRQWAEGNSMSGYKIGYVTGDNIKDKIPQLLKDGWTFPNLRLRRQFQRYSGQDLQLQCLHRP